MSASAQKDYEEYLERYCKQHKISKEEAEKHALVKETKKYYEDSRRGISGSETSTFTPSGECK